MCAGYIEGCQAA